MAGAISLQHQPKAQECLPFVRKSRNSGKNSNGTVHPSGMFSGKKWLYLRMYYVFFARFYRNDRNFLYICFGLRESDFLRRESEKFTVFCKWYNSMRFLFSVRKKKYTSTIWRTIFTKISVKMVSAPRLSRCSRWAQNRSGPPPSTAPPLPHTLIIKSIDEVYCVA